MEAHSDPKPVRIKIEGDATFAEIHRRDVSIFSCDGDPEKARTWLLKLEGVYEDLQCSNQRRIEYVYHLLSSDALSWWEWEESYIKDPASITWVLFKEHFFGQFDGWWYSIKEDMYEWKPMKILQFKDIELRNRSSGIMKVV